MHFYLCMYHEYIKKIETQELEKYDKVNLIFRSLSLYGDQNFIYLA